MDIQTHQFLATSNGENEMETKAEFSIFAFNKKIHFRFYWIIRLKSFQVDFDFRYFIFNFIN